MPEYLSPGVYVEEVERGAKSIEGVSTSTAGFLGQTERGSDKPQFVTSFAEFKRKYGGFAKYRRNKKLEGTSLAYAVDGFFNNGGGRCYIGRVTDATETADLYLGAYAPPETPVADVLDLDFGTIVTNQTEEWEVEVEHPGVEGDPSIELSGISADGPFTVRVTEGPRTVTDPGDLAPGESVTLTVEFEPGEDDENHEGSVTVETMGDGAPLVIELHGTSIDATDEDAVVVNAEPSPLDLGTVVEETTEETTVRVEHAGLDGAAPVEIDDVDIEDADGFGITNDGEVEGTELAVDEGVDVELEFGLEDPEPLDAGILDIEYLVDGDRQDVEVPLRARVVADDARLGAEVALVELGTIPTGSTAETVVVLRHMGGSDDEPLTITGDNSETIDGVEVLPEPGDYEVELAPGQSTTLTITYSSDNEIPNTDGELLIEYDHPDQGDGNELALTLDGEIEDSEGEFAAEPPADDDSTIEYGEVVAGESVTQVVSLMNTEQEDAADAAITVHEIRLEDDEDVYSLPDDLVPEEFEPADAADEASLPPGQTLPIPVTVTPDEAGEVEATLHVRYDDPERDERTLTWDFRTTGVAASMRVEAVGPGEWGGRVAVRVRNGRRTNDLFRMRVQYWSELDDPDGDVDDQDDPDVEETYDELSPSEDGSNYFETVIDSGSNLVRVHVPEGVDPKRPDNGSAFLTMPPSDDGETEDEDEGVGLTHYEGSEEAPRGERTGLAGFAEIDDISIVCVPDENNHDGLTDAVVSHCEDENQKDRIAVLQAERGADLGALPPQNAISEYAAIYCPHIEIVDGETGRRKLVPPGGHVAGIYARSDAEHGVHKAPANETVRGAVGLEYPITQRDQDRLNPKGVNAIRSFPSRGIRVWGARTTSANPSWKYVNVRRLFLYLEESIDEGTQWAVFESNTERLWARVRQSVRNFLLTVWRNGGLAGSTPDEAFYVKADRTTMTQADIDQGKLIVEIGVAPVKPAEFVIFRISQWTEGVSEGS